MSSRGRKNGHPGSRRETPDRVDQHETHPAKVFPECGDPLCRSAEIRTRYTEVHPVLTEHTIRRDWCPQCRKKVEPKTITALPGSTLGNRLLVLTAWLHYALANTLSQIVEVFNFDSQMCLTLGGLLQMGYRLAGILYPWYEQIQQEALESAMLHRDENGSRANGSNY